MVGSGNGSHKENKSLYLTAHGLVMENRKISMSETDFKYVMKRVHSQRQEDKLVKSVTID